MCRQVVFSGFLIGSRFRSLLTPSDTVSCYERVNFRLNAKFFRNGPARSLPYLDSAGSCSSPFTSNPATGFGSFRLLVSCTMQFLVVFTECEPRITAALSNKIYARKTHYRDIAERRAKANAIEILLRRIWRLGSERGGMQEVLLGCKCSGMLSSYPAKAGSPALTSSISVKTAIKPFQQPAMDTKRRDRTWNMKVSARGRSRDHEESGGAKNRSTP